MVAKIDPHAFFPLPPAARPESRVLRWKSVATASEGRLSDTSAQEKLRPARGLLLGLLLGALLWIGIGMLAWLAFR
jgi:hypothetical protein